LINDFQVRNQYHIRLDDSTANLILSLTNGHCGYVSSILHFFNENGLDKYRSKKQQMSNLFSFDLYTHLLGLRCSSYDSLTEKDDIDLFVELVMNKFLFLVPKTMKLVRMGIASLSDEGLIVFNCPMAEDLAFHYLLSPEKMMNITDIGFTDLSDTMDYALSCISYTTVKKSLSLDHQRNLLEAFWQKEIYSILKSLLPAKVVVSSEVQYFDQDLALSGKVDFYVNGGRNWAIELLINGYTKKYGKFNLEEHTERFRPFGKYRPMIDEGICKDWLVIDFSSKEDSRHEFGSKIYRDCWVILYSINDHPVEGLFEVYKFDANGNIFEEKLISMRDDHNAASYGY